MANDRSLPTRERLLAAALERFSRDGWGGTSIRDLARDVGIRESSVYKHFGSKQEIFDALLERADARLATVASGLGVVVDSPPAAVPAYVGITEQRLVEVADGFFTAVLHDAELVALRRLFVVNQYRDPEIGRRLRDYWVGRPVAFQSAVFTELIATGELRPGLDPEMVALSFFGPVLALIQLAETGEADEQRARAMLAAHVRHFRSTHLRES
ncbi:TetR/AcrR family transcriptional regulator [Arsenicicoccus bolidensis]|uniref:TetR/AcrR family transcriptional regulator n=1 Tax=Arsenicicoccus bolidensis TaxID=229480 RepID=UPI0003FAD5CB|nr:TetR/AcrR family transcriptional regulator [Arsenicicoccus bolidensis]